MNEDTLPAEIETAARHLEVRATELSDAVNALLLVYSRELDSRARTLLSEAYSAYIAERAEFRKVIS